MQRRMTAASAANTTRGSGSKSLRRLMIALVCSVTLAASAGTASAEEQMAAEAGLGVGSVLASLVYGPTKLLYATGGVLVGGLAFLFSGGDSDVAGVIMTPSVRGTYVLTPDHLRGEQPIEFLGRAPAYRPELEPTSDRVASAPEPSW